MSKLVLVDGNAIMHRAYHALPPLTGKNGQPINAVYGLVAMLLKVITDLRPTHIAFAFDRKEKTFRQKMHADYQAQRPQMDRDLDSQFEIAKEVIQAFGIPIYDKAGYEADDILGTLAFQVMQKSNIKNQNDKSKSEIEEVVIVTGDRDILQLANNSVKLYMPIAGLSNAKLFGKEEATQRMGVPPAQIVDFKALVGDPSDNYKGVPGIGPKTAIKLLKEYGNLGNIYKNVDSLPEKTRQILQKNKDSAYVSQKLATIVRDLDIDINIGSMAKWQVDSERALGLFNQIGFKTLTQRVKTIGKQLEAEKQMTLV